MSLVLSFALGSNAIVLQACRKQNVEFDTIMYQVGLIVFLFL